MKSRINLKSKKPRYTSFKKSKIQRKQSKRGGALEKNCLADISEFPKCGQEGCVYLDDDTNYVTKKQWKKLTQLDSHGISISGQGDAALHSLAPNIISTEMKPCDLISIKGSENKAPCFVKRYRHTRTGDKILYEEEKRDSWCRSYGTKNQCVVDKQMYDKFKNPALNKVSMSSDGRISQFIKETLPDIDSASDGNPDAEDDEELGDLLNDVPIDDKFTSINPYFLTEIKMNRIKGITINELIEEINNILGKDATMTVSKLWEDEKNKIIKNIADLGYTSSDFHEGNIMIDVDDDRLCPWIATTLHKTKKPITPSDIKKEFGKEKILKIVDWGILQRFSKDT